MKEGAPKKQRPGFIEQAIEDGNKPLLSHAGKRGAEKTNMIKATKRETRTFAEGEETIERRLEIERKAWDAWKSGNYHIIPPPSATDD